MKCYVLHHPLKFAKNASLEWIGASLARARTKVVGSREYPDRDKTQQRPSRPGPGPASDLR